MTKNILPIALLGAAFIFNTGCKNDGGFKKIKGIEYKIVKEGHGKKAAMGDIVEFNIIAKEDTMTLGDSHPQGKPAMARVEEVRGSGQWQAVFPMLAAGDSAVVQISCDTLLKSIPPSQHQLPPWLKAGNKIMVYLAIVSVKSYEDYTKEMDQKAAAQAQTDDKALQDYFAKNNIKAQKTASGLYYSIQQEGSGPAITPGQSVTLNYTGKTINGATFDSNEDSTFHHKSPFTFVVGRGSVIKGWDEGILLFKKGTKGTLYIPSPLAYGSQERGPSLPANSILIFTVDVTDVKAATAPAAPGGKPMMKPAP